MKHNKIFAVLAMAAMLTLGACGGGSDAKSSAGGKSSGGNKSSAAPASSRQPTKNATVETIAFEVKENKAYIKVSGKEELMEQSELLWAWGIRPYADAAEGEELVWLLGKETPADADYKAVDTFDATAKTWSVSLCLADVQGLGGSLYTIYGGMKGGEYAALELTDTTLSVKDGKNSYYVRDDNAASCIAVDVLPPVTLEKASIVTNPDGKTGRYAKIGGAKNATVTEEAIATWTPFINFQNTNGWSNTRIRNSEENPNEWFFKIEGNEFYVYAHVDFMTAGGRYNTHLNLQEEKQQDCKMAVDILTNNVYEFPADNLKITVYSNTKGGRDQEEFWSNLGFIVENITEPEPAE